MIGCAIAIGYLELVNSGYFVVPDNLIFFVTGWGFGITLGCALSWLLKSNIWMKLASPQLIVLVLSVWLIFIKGTESGYEEVLFRYIWYVAIFVLIGSFAGMLLSLIERKFGKT